MDAAKYPNKTRQIRPGYSASEVRRQIEALCDLIGSGAPLDGMSRARALGLVLGLERKLPDADSRGLLHELRGMVRAGERCPGNTDALKLLPALVRRLREKVLALSEMPCLGNPISPG